MGDYAEILGNHPLLPVKRELSRRRYLAPKYGQRCVPGIHFRVRPYKGGAYWTGRP